MKTPAKLFWIAVIALNIHWIVTYDGPKKHSTEYYYTDWDARSNPTVCE